MSRFAISAALVAGALLVAGCGAGASGNEGSSSSTATPSTTKLADEGSGEKVAGTGNAVTFVNGTSGPMDIQPKVGTNPAQNPQTLASTATWSGSAPFNGDESTYQDDNVKVDFHLYQWGNHWMQISVFNKKHQPPILTWCSLALDQSTTVWCNDKNGVDVGQTVTADIKQSDTGPVLARVTAVRGADGTDVKNWTWTASCPESGCAAWQS